MATVSEWVAAPVPLYSAEAGCVSCGKAGRLPDFRDAGSPHFRQGLKVRQARHSSREYSEKSRRRAR